jgi:hypothetical protein
MSGSPSQPENCMEPLREDSSHSSLYCFSVKKFRHAASRISLGGNRRGLFVVVKQDVRRGRLHTELP